MTKEIFYVGTGVNSIFSCSLSSNGELELVRETKTGKGTTWLLKKDQFLYSVNEHDDQIELFSIVDRQNGQIELKGRFSALGNTPCSMDIDPSGKWLAIANYGHEGTSNVAIFPLDSTKSTDGSGGKTTSIEGNGPHASRQDHSHCHQVLFDQQFLYVVDLGTDTLSVYRFDPENGQLTLHGQRIRTEPGAGPRHFVFHPDLPLMFLANELNSTMNVYRVDRSQGQLDFLQTISTRREQDLLDPTKENYPAEIEISPNGKFVLVSNRGDENLVIFKVKKDCDDVVEVEKHLESGGSFTRSFGFDPTGKFLLVLNQKTNNIICHEFDSETSTYQMKSELKNIESPQHFLFV